VSHTRAVQRLPLRKQKCVLGRHNYLASNFQIALIFLSLRARASVFRAWVGGCSAYVTRMADYYSIIAKAVGALDWNTGDARGRLYERARAALIAEMRGATPALNQSDILVARISLEEAIGKVEAEARRDRSAHRALATPSTSLPRVVVVASIRDGDGAPGDEHKPPEGRGETPSGYSPHETDSCQGRANWLTEVLARASREDYGWGDDQDLTQPRELGPNP